PGGPREGERTAVAFSPDGKTVAGGGADGSVIEGDVATGKQVRSFAGGKGPVTALRFSPNGGLLLAADDNGFRLWEATTGKEVLGKQVRTGDGPVGVRAAVF